MTGTTMFPIRNHNPLEEVGAVKSTMREYFS